MEKMEAFEALDDVAVAQRRMRARAHHKGADLIYALWGVIWFTAFACQHFGSDFQGRIGSTTFEGLGIVWTPLVLLGIVLTFVIVRRRGAVRDKNGHKMGLVWPIVFGYFYLWMFMLGPLLNYDMFSSKEGILHMTAVISTVPMCVYVLMGLMGGDKYIAWVGGIVTVLTGIGLWLFHDYFYLWMAVFGGGGLFAAGYFSRRQWTTA